VALPSLVVTNRRSGSEKLMQISPDIPLCRVAVLEAFLAAARKIGVPVEKALRSVGLPTLLQDGRELIAELPAWRFIHSVSQREGLEDFGLVVASMSPHEDIATLSSMLTGCLNLHDLLKRFCQIAPLYATSGHYTLENGRDVVWFSWRGILLDEDVQVQLYELLGMIQLVQLAAGKDWRPTEIHFSIRPRKAALYAPELNPARIVFSQPVPRISIPRHLLARPLTRLKMRVREQLQIQPSEISPLPESFPETLRDAIIPYLGAQKMSKRLAAEISGVSPRTLNRRLSEQGTSYAELLDQARLAKAASMLTETDEKLLDISLMLGYENAANFSRAFRRWTGISPREYRRQSYGV
jgi:AraC-like DNA-binding protein